MGTTAAAAAAVQERLVQIGIMLLPIPLVAEMVCNIPLVEALLTMAEVVVVAHGQLKVDRVD
jgi:hypothetical protein